MSSRFFNTADARSIMRIRQIQSRKKAVMRIFLVTVVALLAFSTLHSIALAQQSDDCKLCREDYRLCKQAHSEAACRTNYDICMKHCRKK
jgi:hypothetical protein